MALMLGYVAFVSANSTAKAETNAALSLGTTLIGEGDDFATQELGLPWNMDTGPYPGPTTVFRQDVNLNNIKIEDGRWKFTSIDTESNGYSPLLYMHWSGIVNTQSVLRLGDRFPINTEKYKLISLYFCSDRDEFGIFYWFYTQAPYDPSSPNKTAWSEFFDINAGCQFYSFDMTQLPKFQGDWVKTTEGYPGTLRFKPQALTSTNASFELDWFRITTIDTGNIVPILWSGVTPGSMLHFYASRTGCGGEDIPLGTQSAGGSTGTFNWGNVLQYWDDGRPYAIPESLEPDFYHIYMRVNDTGAPICAGAQLEIRAAPVAWINKPSMLSGPDYATIKLGDTWGFSNSQDVLATQDIANISFADGLFQGKTTGGGVWLLLNDDDPKIDTSKYKYVSARMYVEGFQTLSGGWMARYYWWNIGPGTDASGTAGQIVFEGWHTYTIDLTKAIMLDENPADWEGTPNGFRYDPIEPVGTPQYNLFIDFVIITGDEIVKAGDIFEVIVDVESEHATTVTLYYDTDTNPNNGRTPMMMYEPEPLKDPLGAHFALLPLLHANDLESGSAELPPLPGESRLWNTAGIAPGAYYVSAVVSDGVNTTTWYSEIPVIIE